MNTVESYTITNPYGKTDECAKITIEDITYVFTLPNATIVGQEYTISFWAMADSEATLFAGGSAMTVTSAWTKHAITFTATSTDVMFGFSATGTYYIYHPQLEIGNTPTDWTPAPEDVEEDIDEVNDSLMQTIHEQRTDIISESNQIILAALESYITTGDHEAFKSTVETQLSVMAGEISMNFASTTEQIQSVDGDLQTKFEEVYKYIQFNENGITIGSGDNTLTLSLDNDMISFSKNGNQFGWWDGVNFHTGNIVVEVNERAQFGNFAYVPRNDGSLMFLKVGG